MSEILNVLVLYGLGLLGWLILRPLRVPVPSLIGTLVVVGGLRLAGIDLPRLPSGLEQAIQILLGLYVGSMITKDTLDSMRLLLVPSAITMSWVLSLAFLGGWVLSTFTYLDGLTGILASSTGGLPEMTVIALAANADVNVIVLFQLLRILFVALAFPFVLKFFAGDRRSIRETVNVVKQRVTSVDRISVKPHTWFVVIPAGVLGGFAFVQLGIPAGGMVGAVVVVVAATMLGQSIHFGGQSVLNVLLVGVGLLAVDSMSPELGSAVVSTAVIWPAVLSLVLTVASSLLLAGVLHRVSEWDYPTCFMAAAPAGLTVMTAMALQYDRDPMPVFIMHMARVLILKTGIPLLLAFFI